MLKKIFKRSFLLCLVVVMMLSGTTIAFAESNVVDMFPDSTDSESYMYYPDNLFVKAGTKIQLKSLRTTNGSFFQKKFELNYIQVVLDTDEIATADFDIILDVKSKSESIHKVYNFKNAEYAQKLCPNFYEDSFVTVTLVAKSDLYIRSYSFT